MAQFPSDPDWRIVKVMPSHDGEAVVFRLNYRGSTVNEFTEAEWSRLISHPTTLKPFDHTPGAKKRVVA